MGKEKIVKGVVEIGKAGLKVGLAAVSSKVLLQNVEPIIKIAHEVRDVFKNDNKVTVPVIFSKECQLDIKSAEEMLSNYGLKYISIPATYKDANAKYHDWLIGQVIYNEPKSGQRVNLGETIKLKYLTQETLDASQALYKQSEEIKKQAIANRAEKIAAVKEMAKQKIPNLKRSDRKNNAEEINEEN